MKQKIKNLILSWILSYLKKYEGITYKKLMKEAQKSTEARDEMKKNRDISRDYMIWIYEIGLELEKNGVTFDPGYYVTKKKIEDNLIEKEIDISAIFKKQL